jgi:hypothetical protein
MLQVLLSVSLIEFTIQLELRVCSFTHRLSSEYVRRTLDPMHSTLCLKQTAR